MKRVVVVLALLASFVVHAKPQTFEWKLVTGGGVPDQLLFVLQGNAPPPRRVVETWKLVIDDAGMAHFTSRRDGKSTTTDSQFVEGAAVIREVPPRVLSMEQVPCSAPVLGGYSGTCTGASGGPLELPPVPLSVVVSSGGDLRKSIESLVLTIFTAGLIIPGQADTSVIAHLSPAPKRALSAELEKWKAGKKREADLPESLDAELAGARLVLTGRVNHELIVALTRRVPELDRWSIIRLARQRGLSPEGLLATVSMLELPQDEALMTSALVQTEELVSAGVRELVAGHALTLRAQAARWGSKSFDAETMKLLEAGGLEPAECGALVTMLSRAARQKSLPRLLEVVPLEVATRVLALESEGRSPTQSEALLKKAPGWIDRMVLAGRGAEATQVVAFDDARARLLNASVARMEGDDRPQALSFVVASFSFDDERMKTLTRFAAIVPDFNSDQAARAVGSFSSRDLRVQALVLVLGKVRVEVQRGVVEALLRKATFDDDRSEVLAVAPVGSFDAVAELKAFSFDSGRVKGACAVVKKDPASLKLAITAVDSGRLEVLACAESAKKLSAAEKAKLLELFSETERAKAEAALR